MRHWPGAKPWMQVVTAMAPWWRIPPSCGCRVDVLQSACGPTDTPTQQRGEQMRAAVLRQTGDTKVDIVDNMELEDIGPGMVRVAIRATGVCHSDLSAMTGVIPQ